MTSDEKRPSVPGDRPTLTGAFVPAAHDHLADLLPRAVERFAQEDGVTVEEWVRRCARYCAITRLTMEAKLDYREHLSADRSGPQRVAASGPSQPTDESEAR